jgi:hypothetical protein
MICELLLLLFGAQIKTYELNELRLAIDLMAERTPIGTELFIGKVKAGPVGITLFNENRKWLLLTESNRIYIKRLSPLEMNY